MKLKPSRPLTGEEFKNMVKGAGVKLSDVAEISGAHPGAASRWYCGRKDIYLKTYDKLVEGYMKIILNKD